MFCLFLSPRSGSVRTFQPCFSAFLSASFSPCRNNPAPHTWWHQGYLLSPLQPLLPHMILTLTWLGESLRPTQNREPGAVRGRKGSKMNKGDGATDARKQNKEEPEKKRNNKQKELLGSLFGYCRKSAFIPVQASCRLQGTCRVCNYPNAHCISTAKTTGS